MEEPSQYQQTDKTSHQERFLHLNVKTENQPITVQYSKYYLSAIHYLAGYGRLP